MLNNTSALIQQVENHKNTSQLRAAILASAVIASFFAIPHTALGACNTYYVSLTGNNTNPGTITRPWRTVSKASSLKPCERLYVRAGTYVENRIWLGSKTGSASQPIQISAYESSPGVFEKVVLDVSTKPIVSGWDSFFYVEGSYYKISRFEMRNGGMGVELVGPNNTVSNNYLHHMQNNGVLARGDNSLVENNVVSDTCLDHMKNITVPDWASAISAIRDPVNGLTEHAIIRGNTVYNNWGEGIATFSAVGTIIENNTVYDNWAENTYIDNATNVIFRNNLVYTTPNTYKLFGKRANLLSLADENNGNDRLPSANNKVINNMFYNGTVCAFSWTLVPGSGLKGALIANNTFVNTKLSTGNINSGSTIKNNIFFRNDGDILANVPTRDGLTLSNNLWSQAAPANASGPGDVTGDPLLVGDQDTLKSWADPTLVPVKDDFALKTGSPAINKGAAIYDTTDDYLITSSGSLNIGAYKSTTLIQYVSGNYVPGSAIAVK